VACHCAGGSHKVVEKHQAIFIVVARIATVANPIGIAVGVAWCQ
jgi:hypothetical protein